MAAKSREADPAKRKVGGWFRRRYFPGWIVQVVVLALLAGFAYVATMEATQDHGFDHVVALILLVAAMLVLLCWFVGFSAYSPWLRRGAGLFAMLGAVAFLAVMEPEFSAEMIPKFRPRWLPKPDQRLEMPRASNVVDLATTTPDDFPQYLGPNRDGSVDHVRLARSWERPPQELWRQPIGAGWSGFVAVNGNAVTMEQRGEEELITCYRIEDGQLQWSNALAVRHETAMGGVGPRGTPAIHDGKVYATGGTAVLRCVDAGSGQGIWSIDLVQHFGSTPKEEATNIAWGRANSPLVVDPWVIVAAGGPQSNPCALAAFDKDTGEMAWRSDGSQISYSSPLLGAVGGEPQVVCVNESSVAGYRVSDGKQRWSFPWAGHSNGDANTSQPVLLGEDRLVVSKGYLQGAALWEISREGDDFAPRQLWENARVLKTKLTSAIHHEGYLYGLSDGILQCVDASNGKRAWHGKRFYHGQILRVQDLLLVISESGELALVELNPQEYVELGSMPDALDGKCWNTLCLYGNRLLARSGSEAACYELPLP